MDLIFFGLLFAKSFSEKLGNIFCHDTCTLSGISPICVVCVHNKGNDSKQIAYLFLFQMKLLIAHHMAT